VYSFLNLDFNFDKKLKIKFSKNQYYFSLIISYFSNFDYKQDQLTNAVRDKTD